MKKIVSKTCVMLLLSVAAMAASAEDIVLINPFKVPENTLNESIEYWEKARDFLSTQPGYVSTKLHSAIQLDAQYQLINVAQWSSVHDFKVAHKNMKSYFNKHKIMPPAGLTPYPALYSVIRE